MLPTRLRKNSGIRNLVRETQLSMNDVVYPLFVVDGQGIRREIGAMKDQYQLSLDLLGAEILATISEYAGRPVQAARVTAADQFPPYRFENQMETLPSLRRLLTRVAEMLELELRWEAPPTETPGRWHPTPRP